MIPSTSLLASGGMVGVRVNIDNTSIIGTSAAMYRLNSTGAIEAKYKSSGGYTNIGTWLVSGVAADYDVDFTSDIGGGSGWVSLSTSPQWAVTSPPGYDNVENLTVTIRDHSTLAVLDTASVYMEASN